MDALTSGQLTPYKQPTFPDTSLEITSSGFRAITQSGDKTTSIPVVLGGYGHFYDVVKDGEFLREIGSRLIQQERGPNSQIPNGAVAGASQILNTISNARKDGWFVDFLLSPHYMHKNLFSQHPDLTNSGNSGFLKYNIDHPVARNAIETWIRGITPVAIKTGSSSDNISANSLFAFCLSNEPGYSDSGRNPQSLPLWINFLREKHGNNLENLNAAHHTRYSSFDEVPVPPYSKYPTTDDPTALAAFYDWTRFNNQHFADWHRWMRDLVKDAAANASLPPPAVHIKTMPDVFDARPPSERTHSGILSRGVDPELLTELTDIAGCDTWSFVSPRDADWHYTWLRTHLFYDLLNSFNKRPVFDSEMHVIVDRHPAELISSDQIYTTHWQGALHHRTAWATWKWGEPGGHSSLGSIYLRPANLFAATKATHDLNRLAAEIEAINATPAHVAILYSPTSLYWQPEYPIELRRLYTSLTMLGHKITFISERQLTAQNAKIADSLEVIFLPSVTHTASATRAALTKLATEKTITIASIGDDNLRYDEYNRDFSDAVNLSKIRSLSILSKKQISKKPVGFETSATRAIELKTLARFLGKNMRSQQPISLFDLSTPNASKTRAFGIEYRDITIATSDGTKRRLLPLTNLSRKSLRVRLDLPSLPANAVVRDLISGQSFDIQKDFELRPLTPLLLEIRSR